MFVCMITFLLPECCISVLGCWWPAEPVREYYLACGPGSPELSKSNLDMAR